MYDNNHSNDSSVKKRCSQYSFVPYSLLLRGNMGRVEDDDALLPVVLTPVVSVSAWPLLLSLLQPVVVLPVVVSSSNPLVVVVVTGISAMILIHRPAGLRTVSSLYSLARWSLAEYCSGKMRFLGYCE